MPYSSSVYQDNNFQGRVEFAAAVIARGGHTTRNFDTCFEMADGHEVSAALYRRVLARPEGRLAANFSRYVNVELAKEDYEVTKGLTLKQLEEQAAKSRAASKKGTI